MSEHRCAGLPGHWVNAWLAAVGAVVLDPALRVRWSSDGSPVAILSAPDADPVDRLAAAWPAREELEELPIAVDWRESPAVPRKVPVTSFAARCRAARSHERVWTLSSTMTDLHVDRAGEVAHAPFDPSAPGPAKWLHHRLLKVHAHVDSSADRIGLSLAGTAPRTKDNGLGFDVTRFASQADDTDRRVDPVVEVLAFFGMMLLPVRGDGSDARISRKMGFAARQRGWRRIDGRGTHFHWPAWKPPLDAPGIDALLDLWDPASRARWNRFGVHAGWRTVPYQRRSSGDPTRGFASQRL